jgi:glycosyltransferase involved in cell wall biosynthesis
MSVLLQNTKFGELSVDWEWWIGINGHGHSGGPALEAAIQLVKKAGGAYRDRIHVVNMPVVRGKTAALNRLVEYSKGEWIALLDCDDTWDRNKLMIQRAMAANEAQGAAAIGSFCYYFGDFVSDGPMLPMGWIAPSIIANENPIINSSVIIKRAYARWEDRYGLEDYDLWIRLAKQGLCLYNVPLRLVHHRIHKGSAFNGTGRQDLAGLRAYHRLPDALKGRDTMP